MLTARLTTNPGRGDIQHEVARIFHEIGVLDASDFTVSVPFDFEITDPPICVVESWPPSTGNVGYDYDYVAGYEAYDVPDTQQRVFIDYPAAVGDAVGIEGNSYLSEDGQTVYVYCRNIGVGTLIFSVMARG